jgi:hypothetical protein
MSDFDEDDARKGAIQRSCDPKLVQHNFAKESDLDRIIYSAGHETRAHEGDLQGGAEHLLARQACGPIGIIFGDLCITARGMIL